MTTASLPRPAIAGAVETPEQLETEIRRLGATLAELTREEKAIQRACNFNLSPEDGAKVAVLEAKAKATYAILGEAKNRYAKARLDAAYPPPVDNEPMADLVAALNNIATGTDIPGYTGDVVLAGRWQEIVNSLQAYARAAAAKAEAA